MRLDAQIAVLQRRANRLIKSVNPPDLFVHIYPEGKKNPTSGTKWELGIKVEKRPLMEN